jgi:predicted ester cyclase
MAQDDQEKLEANKALVRRWFDEVVNQGDMRVFDEICMVCAPQSAMISGVIEPAPKGMQGARDLVVSFREAIPDVHYTVEEQLAEGDKVFTRLTFEGTHQGTLFGIPPTGKHVRASVMSLWTIIDGHLGSERVNWDALGAFQQLGLIPSFGPS